MEWHKGGPVALMVAWRMRLQPCSLIEVAAGAATTDASAAAGKSFWGRLCMIQQLVCSRVTWLRVQAL